MTGTVKGGGVTTIAPERVIAPVVPEANDEFCHIESAPEAPTSICGMLLTDRGASHDGEFDDGYCTGCGKPACPTCALLETLYW